MPQQGKASTCSRAGLEKRPSRTPSPTPGLVLQPHSGSLPDRLCCPLLWAGRKPHLKQQMPILAPREANWPGRRSQRTKKRGRTLRASWQHQGPGGSVGLGTPLQGQEGSERPNPRPSVSTDRKASCYLNGCFGEWLRAFDWAKQERSPSVPQERPALPLF